MSGNSIEKSFLYALIGVKGPSNDFSAAAGLAKETLGDFAIYTFVNTIPYELINSLAYAVGDTILTSNTNNKRSSGSTKKSTRTNGGSNNNSKKTPAPPSSRKGNIRPLTPMDPIINSWNFKNNNFHAW